MGFVNAGPWANFKTEAPDTLENGSVGTNQLVDLSVTTQKIANGSVTTGKLSNVLRLSNMRTFDTVSTMQAATELEAGMTCHTNGFHSAGDGGAAYYTVGASGTANGMDVLALQGGLYATLVVTEPYVMPEMFGAYGDGTHDDAAAINRMFSVSGYSFSFSPKTYRVNTVIDIDASGISIIGNGCTINSGSGSALRISETSHDIEITGVNFVQSFEVDSTGTPNYGIGILGTSATALYQAYNISISECSFSGGVFGINATTVMNLEVARCYFGSFVYVASSGAGGYGILTQSCIDVNVHDCYFKRGDYGRHDIYVSISQNKTDNIKSMNYVIDNCLFDMSDASTQASGAYYSGSTQCINVRYIDNLKITNCIGMEATGIVCLTGVDGAVKNVVINNITSIAPHFFASTIAPLETRATVNLSYNTSDGSIEVSNIETINPDNALYLDATFTGGYVNIRDMVFNYKVNVANVTALYVSNCKYNTGGLAYTGTDVLYGKLSNIQSKGTSAITVITASNDGVLHPSLFSSDQLGAFVISNAGTLAASSASYKAALPFTYSLSTNDMVFSFPKLSALPKFASAISGTATLKLYDYNFSDSAKTIKIRAFNTSGTQLTAGSLASRVMLHV